MERIDLLLDLTDAERRLRYYQEAMERPIVLTMLREHYEGVINNIEKEIKRLKKILNQG